eukprot:TRINITY_DN55151_c0_g1_i1.p1 TRINITY_DN55151_c0_g1~~TRINITY_DN55151_c0_g1_i1.p1  ORF type:complete len:440 (+),score=53.08 TRINITY_DN55151_c0_g1_i1:59-1378(+)
MSFAVNTTHSRANKQFIRRLIKDNGWKEAESPCQRPSGSVIWIALRLDLEWQIQQRNAAQWTNLVPGLSEMCAKVPLAQLLEQTNTDWPFWPKTWILPRDWSALERICNSNPSKKKTFIVKPSDGGGGGGIFLFQSTPTSSHKMQNLNIHTQNAIVQSYLNKPLLFRGYKFDFRLYVAVLFPGSSGKHWTFLCTEGLARFCSKKYVAASTANLHNTFSHLTNYSLNKLAVASELPASEEEEAPPCKLPVSEVLPMLEDMGVAVDVAWQGVRDMAASVVDIFAANLPEKTPNCFQILGFDVLLNASGKPFLLEVNAYPSLMIDQVIPVQVQKSSPTKMHALKGLPPPKNAKSKRIKAPTPPPKTTVEASLPVLPEGEKLCKCMEHHRPHYHTDSPVDVNVKGKVISGVLKMVKVVQANKAEVLDPKEVAAKSSVYQFIGP